MTGLVTSRFRAFQAEQFYESLSEAAPSRLYVFIGRSYPWANDSAQPTPQNSVQSTEFDPYRDALVYKRVQTSDAAFVAQRYSWANNTFFTQYTDSNANLANSQFYTYVDATRNVYKCIDNNRGANSTVAPTGTGTSIITTADRYRWKFLFQVSSGDAMKFSTINYFPVKTLSANDASAQWSVQQAAANGAIHHIIISANGTGYLSTSNTFALVSNAISVRLNTNASTTDGVYIGSDIFINSGLGASQLRKIVGYVGATRRVTVNTAFTITPNTSSTYIVGPRVIIRGDSGLSVGTRATAYVSNCYGGQVRRITMISEGSGYSQANAVITANSSHGSGAIVSSVISPPGGHGKDPVGELYASGVMLNVKYIGAEANALFTNNDIRTVGLVRDPLLRSGPAANVAIIDGTHRLTLTGVDGDFISDELITGQTSKATGKFVFFANTNSLGNKGIARLIRVVSAGTGKLFHTGERVVGSTSGVSATITSYNRPAIREASGDVLYIENIQPITRDLVQTEDIKLVVKF